MHKSAGKTLADCFASCENNVWISFKRIYEEYPPPLLQLIHIDLHCHPFIKRTAGQNLFEKRTEISLPNPLSQKFLSELQFFSRVLICLVISLHHEVDLLQSIFCFIIRVATL